MVLPVSRIFGFLLPTELSLQLAEFFEMERQRLLVLKPASIGNHGSLFTPTSTPTTASGVFGAADSYLDLDTHIPVPRFTGNRRPKDLDLVADHLFALIALLQWQRCFSLVRQSAAFLPD